MKSRFTVVKCLALIFGVLIIPVLYSYFYLDAFWDPYNNLGKLPVAVVNEDRGADIGGQNRNLGEEIADRMKKDASLKWVFTSENDAKSGVEGKRYYASIIIPADFSGSIASASTTNKTIAHIDYQSNEKRNYLASQILTRAVVQLEEQTRSSVNQELTRQLTDKLAEVPKNLADLKTGLDTLSGGASDLSGGAATLGSGLAALSTGAQSLKGGAASLSSGLGDAFAGISGLNSGAQSLSAGVANAQSGAVTLATGAVTLDGGLSQALSGAQSLLAQLKAGVTAPTFLDGLTGVKNGLSQLLAQLSPAAAGGAPTAVDQFHAAADTYSGSMDSMMFGLVYTHFSAMGGSNPATYSTAVAGMQSFTAALKAQTDAAVTGFVSGTVSQQALAGDINIYDAYENFYKAVLDPSTNGGLSPAGYPTADAYQTAATGAFVQAMKHNAFSYSTANAQAAPVVAAVNAQNAVLAGDVFKSGIDTGLFAVLSANVAQLSGGSQQLSAQLAPAASGASPTLYDGVSQLTGALAQLKDGSAQVSSGAQTLNAGLTQLGTGSAQLRDGVQSLAAGLARLKDGSALVEAGAVQVSAGAQDAKTGGASLAQGAAALANGVTAARDGVAASVDTANASAASLNGLDQYASAPVEVRSGAVNPVPDYGTAFAPYFLSLSLWVGGLIVMVGIYLDPKRKFRSLSMGDSGHGLRRTFVFSVIGIGQAVLLAAAIRWGLHLQVKNDADYFLACILTAFTFSSIVQFLIINLKDVGKFLAIAFLILQLTSCGGTFPMETVPKIFNVLYPYMPMTYSVGLFKEVISGISTAGALYNTYVLLVILAAFTSFNVIFSFGRRVKARAQKALSAQADPE